MKPTHICLQRKSGAVRATIEALERRTLLTAYALNTLAPFNGADGANPWAGVTLDANGDLFGTAYQGGASGLGTVFELTTGATPPAAVITAPIVISPTDIETITVVYSDPSTPIDQSTIAGNNLMIISPNGTTLMPTLSGTIGSGNTITAMYSIAPPNSG